MSRMASLSKGVTIHELRSNGVEESPSIAATERVRGLPPSGTLAATPPAAPGSEDLGPGDECIIAETVDSFPGDERRDDGESGSIYPMRE
jgi:hypothetical protein